MRFAGVGVMGFGVQLGVLHVLTAYLRLEYALAVVLAVEAAILHNFVWHQGWTWRDRLAASSRVNGGTEAAPPGRSASLGLLLRFNAASGPVSLLGNVLLTALFVELVGAPVIIANVLAVIALTVANFLLADRLVFAAAPVAILAAVLCAGSASTADAAGLKSETVAAWNEYVARVEARRAGETMDDQQFRAGDRARLARGLVMVENVAGRGVEVAGGTISHWRGAVFVRGVALDELLEGAAFRGSRVRHPDDVIAARVLSRAGDSLRVFLKLQRQAIVTVAYNTEHHVTFERHRPTSASSRSVATRIAELGEVGTPREHEKPAGADRGFMWRLHSYWRYLAVPGGVIVEVESLTLSRDLPWALRQIAGPIIDRIARDSITRTLAVLR
jgi:putative flippase GtrA